MSDNACLGEKKRTLGYCLAVHGLFGVCSLENVGSVRKVQDGGRS